MARITRAAAHLPREEVKTRMITDPRPLYRQRWLIIYNALVEPRKAEDIARHCGVSKATVHAVIASYNQQGVAAGDTASNGGGPRGQAPVAAEARATFARLSKGREGAHRRPPDEPP